MARRLDQAFDSFLDGSERLQAGFDRNGGSILQYLGCNGIAQRIEIVDQLSAARREKQPIGAPILGVVPALEKAVFDQTIKQARLVLGGVAPIPWRAVQAEKFLAGKTLTADVLTEVARLALEGAQPLEKNAYKVPLTQTLVRRALAQAVNGK